MWEEITYPFLNFNGWISNFIPHFTRCVITYLCWDLIYSILVKEAPDRRHAIILTYDNLMLITLPEESF